MTELVLSMTVFAVLGCWLYTMREKEQAFNREREEWHIERQQLLDRIQAPSFAEYTNKVVREKKAEHPEETQQKPEYIG